MPNSDAALPGCVSQSGRRDNKQLQLPPLVLTATRSLELTALDKPSELLVEIRICRDY